MLKTILYLWGKTRLTCPLNQKYILCDSIQHSTPVRRYSLLNLLLAALKRPVICCSVAVNKASHLHKRRVAKDGWLLPSLTNPSCVELCFQEWWIQSLSTIICVYFHKVIQLCWNFNLHPSWHFLALQSTNGFTLQVHEAFVCRYLRLKYVRYWQKVSTW